MSAVQCFTLYSTVLFLCCSLISYTFVYLCGLQGVSTSPGTLQSFPWIVADVVIAGDTYKVYGNIIYCDIMLLLEYSLVYIVIISVVIWHGLFRWYECFFIDRWT